MKMYGFSPLDFGIDDYLDLDECLPQNSIKPKQKQNEIKNPLNALDNLGDNKLEIEDPTPDIWEMFRDFDTRFFNGVLVDRGVEVDWSPKMTQCAGLCRFSPSTFQCGIKLSKPLLQLRSRKDLVETLLHEMIHALLFVLQESDNRESHGPKFHDNMYRINRAAQLNITVYHTFHDEVNHYRTHVWRCKGPCRDRRPFFGWVKRSMNRKPGPYDTWWNQHQQTCGGEFEKVSEPEGFNGKKSKKNEDNSKIKDIRNFFTPTKSNPSTSSENKTNILTDNQSKNQPKASSSNIVGFDDLNDKEMDDVNESKSIIPFQGVGNVLGGSNNPQPGRSILLTKFDKNSINTHNIFGKKAISSTVTSESLGNSTNNTNSIASSSSTNSISTLIDHVNSSNKLTNVNKNSKETNLIRSKSPFDHFDNSIDSPAKNGKRQKVNETIILSDSEDDDYNWLADLSDQQLLTISQPGPIVID